MKHLLLWLAATLLLFAAQTHTAKILQTIDAAGYTYIKVQEGHKTYWIAMTQRKVDIGESISFDEQGWFSQFHSKALNKTFDKILFASDPTIQKIPTHTQTAPDILNSKFKTKQSITIAEAFKNRNKYAGKKVVIRARVTKVSRDIMQRHWVHLEDGSRYAGMDDIVFTTTKQTPKEGEIVIATGVLAKDKDFGYGYFYPVIVENAEFKLK